MLYQQWYLEKPSVLEIIRSNPKEPPSPNKKDIVWDHPLHHSLNKSRK